MHLDRASDHRWVMHDPDWVPIADRGWRIARRTALKEMIAAAEALARGFDFVRVDLYQPAAQPLFGELSFYPGSGLAPKLNGEMGASWLRAGGRRLVARGTGGLIGAELPA